MEPEKRDARESVRTWKSSLDFNLPCPGVWRVGKNCLETPGLTYDALLLIPHTVSGYN